MMGISCTLPQQFPSTSSSAGKVIVTDMDSIEKSNLSRQFLFRNKDINKPKSTTAINAVTSMNPMFHGTALEQKVATETENIFNDDFYEALDMVCTALDNVEARLYLDQKCLFYNKPMLESGTLGAKGHTQIVVPGKTENYGATRDPPEKSIPVCTLKHFPNQIEHTLQWAREWFEEVFKQLPDDVSEYLNNEEFLPQLDTQPNIKLETLQRLKDSLVISKPNNIADCVAWARKQFEDLFSNRIKQLLHNFPLDRLTSSGTPFWSGSKKPPTPIEFDPTDPLHAEFIISVANMRASIYNIPACHDHSYMLSVACTVTVEKFQPQEGVKIAATEEEAKAEQKQKEQKLESASDLDRVCASILQSLPSPQELKASNLVVQSIEFEKDLDSHMHVIASSSNLRARNYKIPEADLHKSRGIAGKITPAIATTTALVTGAICMELYKILLNKKADQYLNTFTNLAVPLFTSMEPEPPKIVKSKIKGQEWKWTQVRTFFVISVAILLTFLSLSLFFVVGSHRYQQP
jgi:ubiquitin-activating enzyme E1